MRLDQNQLHENDICPCFAEREGGLLATAERKPNQEISLVAGTEQSTMKSKEMPTGYASWEMSSAQRNQARQLLVLAEGRQNTE